MAKDETGFEVVEAKLAELYQWQRERIERRVAAGHCGDNIREEIAAAKDILSEWLWCLEAKDRARRRVEDPYAAIKESMRNE